MAMARTMPAGGDFDGWVRLLAVDSYRQRARRHLFRSGVATVPALRRGLHHEDATVRRVSAALLDHVVDEAALPDLVAALDDPDPAVLKSALHSLACDACKDNACRPGDDLFVPRAIELLDHPHPGVRASAIDALARVARRTPGIDSPAAAALARVERQERIAGLRSVARKRLAEAARVHARAAAHA
jgi:HEAT repeat protein